MTIKKQDLMKTQWALKSLTQLPKKFFLFPSIKRPLKMIENDFYFVFRSQDIKVSVLNFYSCRKNDLLRKIRLISKLTSHCC